MQAVPPQTPPPNRPTPPPPTTAIIAGEQRYTAIKNVPILAIFAVPHDLGNAMKDKPEIRAAMESIDQRNVGNQANLFEAAGPNVKVVRLPHANHYVFRSNEADVLREMNAFIATLPKAQAKNPSTPAPSSHPSAPASRPPIRPPDQNPADSQSRYANAYTAPAPLN